MHGNEIKIIYTYEKILKPALLILCEWMSVASCKTPASSSHMDFQNTGVKPLRSEDS